MNIMTVLLISSISFFAFIFIIAQFVGKDEHYDSCFSSNDYNINEYYKSLTHTTTDCITSAIKAISSEIKINKKIVKADLYAFSFFYVRLICIQGCRDKDIANELTTDMLKAFTEETKYTIPMDFATFISILNNRISVFEELYMIADDREKIVDSLLDEMGILLAHDVLYGKYVPFSLTLPMPVLNFEYQFTLDLTIKAFFVKYVGQIDNLISKIRKTYGLE